MTPLDQIKVASPCHADWNAMLGTEQIRFCGQCRKNVYNLSKMARAEAEKVVLQHEGHLCVRFHTRADGTMLTQDCPVGLRAARYRRMKKFSYAATVLLACGTGVLHGACAVTTRGPAACAVKPMKKPVHVSKPLPLKHTIGKIAPPVMGAPLPPAAK